MTCVIKRFAVYGFTIGLVSAFATTAFAQTNSLFGNTSPASGATGTTANRGTAVGGGAATAGRAGTAGTAGNALNSGIGSTQLGDLSNSVGQGGFVGRSDNAGRFVGNANAAQQTNRNSTNFRGVRGQNGNVQPGLSGQTQLKIRPVHRVAFTYTPRAMAKMSTSLNSQFTRLAKRSPRFQGLTLALNANHEVVLRGIVKTEATRRLAAAMARLEPGVRKVKNEIVVSSGN